MTCHSRREILKSLGAGALVTCAGCAGSDGPTPPPPKVDVSAGNVSSHTVGSLQHYAVSIDATLGAITVHVGSVVSSSTRTTAS